MLANQRPAFVLRVAHWDAQTHPVDPSQQCHYPTFHTVLPVFQVPAAELSEAFVVRPRANGPDEALCNDIYEACWWLV